MSEELDTEALGSIEPIFTKIFAGIGIVTVLYILLRLFNFIQLYAKACTLDEYKHSAEPWALVTGSTDGLGSGFATELAERGFNVILHGRNSTKLASCKSKLETVFANKGLKFETLLLDVSTTTPQTFENLPPLPRISVLVNNVGAGDGERQTQRFLNRSLTEVQTILTVNAGFTALFTRYLIPKLAQPAVIINVGSVLGTWGVAYFEPYSGAKAFVAGFSDALRTEMMLEKQRIEVIHVKVLSAATNSSGTKESLLTVSPRTMARGALDRVGSGAASTSACFRHELMVWFAELWPRDMLSKSISQDVRKRIKKSD